MELTCHTLCCKHRKASAAGSDLELGCGLLSFMAAGVQHAVGAVQALLILLHQVCLLPLVPLQQLTPARMAACSDLCLICQVALCGATEPLHFASCVGI